MIGTTKEFLGSWKGKLCIVDEMPMHSEPVTLRSYYPIGVSAQGWGKLMGNRVFKSGSPEFGIYVIDNSPNLRVQLQHGGRTKPVHVAKEPIKPPKVRAGMETRYRDGRWQKYTKTRGWVDA